MSAGRILVVDDDPQIRRAMRTTLTARGYEVADARTGEEALEALRSGNYDLVLLDMNMPGMGGIETCRLIRPTSEVAIIMLTVSMMIATSELERIKRKVSMPPIPGMFISRSTRS